MKGIRSYCGWGFRVSGNIIHDDVYTPTCEHDDAERDEKFCPTCGMEQEFCPAEGDPFGIDQGGKVVNLFTVHSIVHQKLGKAYFVGLFDEMVVSEKTTDHIRLVTQSVSDVLLVIRKMPKAIVDDGSFGLWHFCVPFDE